MNGHPQGGPRVERYTRNAESSSPQTGRHRQTNYMNVARGESPGRYPGGYAGKYPGDTLGDTPGGTSGDTRGDTPGIPRGVPRGTPWGTPLGTPRRTPRGTPRGTPNHHKTLTFRTCIREACRTTHVRLPCLATPTLTVGPGTGLAVWPGDTPGYLGKP